MSGEPSQSQTTDGALVQEFRAKVLALLNFGWPHRTEVDDDTARQAQVLASQLRNWETWK
jgi:hypothetical protein